MALGAEKAWEWLWSYREWLVAIARSDYRNIIHGDENRAHDLADDVLLRAAGNIKKLRDKRKVKPWLRAILKNVALDLREGQQGEVQNFAQWLSATQPDQQHDNSFRYFAFLSLLELAATKAERAYIASLKKDAKAQKVVNIPKNRAVQLLKKRLHAKGAKYAAEQIKMAQRFSNEMADMESVAKQITADIAAHFKKTVRSVQVPDELVWEWCCAMVVGAMRAGLAEAKHDKSGFPAVDTAVQDVLGYVLKTVLIQAAANIPRPKRKRTKKKRKPK